MNKRPRAGDYALGSIESRAAARAMMRGSGIVTAVVITTGLPQLIGETVTINPPDTIERYLAPDNSLVEVICREYAPGQFTAFIHQTWQDGSVYNGSSLINTLEGVALMAKSVLLNKCDISEIVIDVGLCLLFYRRSS
jgi:hypothetical protein